MFLLWIAGDLKEKLRKEKKWWQIQRSFGELILKKYYHVISNLWKQLSNIWKCLFFFLIISTFQWEETLKTNADENKSVFLVHDVILMAVQGLWAHKRWSQFSFMGFSGAGPASEHASNNCFNALRGFPAQREQSRNSKCEVCVNLQNKKVNKQL